MQSGSRRKSANTAKLGQRMKLTAPTVKQNVSRLSVPQPFHHFRDRVDDGIGCSLMNHVPALGYDSLLA
jgi:hypothetical protein